MLLGILSGIWGSLGITGFAKDNDFVTLALGATANVGISTAGTAPPGMSAIIAEASIVTGSKSDLAKFCVFSLLGRLGLACSNFLNVLPGILILMLAGNIGCCCPPFANEWLGTVVLIILGKAGSS